MHILYIKPQACYGGCACFSLASFDFQEYDVQNM
jgi:hypothetical protein